VCKFLAYIIGSFAAYGEAYCGRGPIVDIGAPAPTPVKKTEDKGAQKPEVATASLGSCSCSTRDKS